MTSSKQHLSGDAILRPPHEAEVRRVLDPEPVLSLDDHVRVCEGGVGLDNARRAAPETIIDTLDRAGLRGRGGAGFPTAVKWRSVRDHTSGALRPRVVINGAEGEPGSFKDRALLRTNPYRVLEGALIGAIAVGATEVIVAVKKTFRDEIDRLRDAIAELDAAGWIDGIDVRIFEGPTDYLFGEETALLEAIEGRDPKPRVTPPYRRGVDTDTVGRADNVHDGSAAVIDLAATEVDTGAAPALVQNVETFAHVAMIAGRGAEWFRLCGTDDSPGTVVCTVTGATRRHGVGEFPMGTPVSTVIDALGGGARDDHTHVALLSGVANAFLPADLFDTPMTHADLAATGSGIGACGFIVFDDSDDIVAVAAGVARFLADESCGQCRPCEVDGAAIAERLERAREREVRPDDFTTLEVLVETVADGARCNLAVQQETVTRSLLELFSDDMIERTGGGNVRTPYAIAPIVDIDDDVATLTERET